MFKNPHICYNRHDVEETLVPAWILERIFKDLLKRLPWSKALEGKNIQES